MFSSKIKSSAWQWIIVFFITSLYAVCSLAAKPKKLTKPSAIECFESSRRNFSEVFACYRQSQASLPLTYAKIETSKIADVERRRYQLISQSWSPHHAAMPEKWLHTVDIYIPEHALPRRALLVLNNGLNYGPDHLDYLDHLESLENGSVTGLISPNSPTDFSTQTLRAIATQTRTIVVSVSYVPNQYLKYQVNDQNDEAPKKEDDSVAYSWKLFLAAPEARAFFPLHIPMMEAAVKGMDLAEKELKLWNIHRFIATGISKRAWTSWHAAIADRRIVAIVPFVIDNLSTSEVLEHTYQTYGRNWPIAFGPYYRAGIDEQRKTVNFSKLMKIQDPLRYLDSAYANRLAIPKYIVNASGDDFFTSDNARWYFDQLPGIKTLRVVPNSDHRGIRKYTEQTLVTLISRLQWSNSLPTLTYKLGQETTAARASAGTGTTTLSVKFSELPVQITQWTAVNPVARDFRYACGIHFVATPLTTNATRAVRIPIEKPTTGWQALFVEARFADGFIATTPVYISPDGAYPITAPPHQVPACETLPGR